MSKTKITSSTDQRWTERKLDLSAEREYLARRLDAVNELLTLVNKQQSRQGQPDADK